MKIDRDKFFAGYRAKFGALNQSQVDGLNQLFVFIEGDEGAINEWTDIRQLSYFLATIKHECADKWHPIEEYASGRAYEGRKDLGNTQAGDGVRYKGRGYVQITGRRNYTFFANLLNVDLVGKPEIALEAPISYAISQYGMHHGSFTGKKLVDYISGNKCQYDEARRIINGKDRAALIAGYATNFEAILKASTN